MATYFSLGSIPPSPHPPNPDPENHRWGGGQGLGEISAYWESHLWAVTSGTQWG